MYRENHPLSTRGVAKGLIHGLAANQGNEVSLADFLLWPPDLFALTSKILSLSGAYTNVLSPPEGKAWPPSKDWTKKMTTIGLAWRMGLENIVPAFEDWKKYFNAFSEIKTPEDESSVINILIERNIIPKELYDIWFVFANSADAEIQGTINEFQCINTSSKNLEKLWENFEALISLHAIADEACVGWGIRTFKTIKFPDGYIEDKKGVAQEYAEKLLNEYGTMATINTARGRVLPKRHTPSVGITLRSLSASLAFNHSSVDVKWRSNFNVSNDFLNKFERKHIDLAKHPSSPELHKALSVLLFPWPFSVSAVEFQRKKPDEKNSQVHKNQGYFGYSPGEINYAEFKAALSEAIRLAKKENGEHEAIDLVILPECALDNKGIGALEEVLLNEKIPAYITGKRVDDEKSFMENLVRFNMIDNNKFDNSKALVEQSKHHRWKLTRSQVLKYNLGHVLSPNKSWWEAISVKRREVNFINIAEELTICPLICEDLARQDPIADLIRTIGPSLVVTILMDGPQKLERWSAKYASVLAEDPGCAVITLTSWGMVKRSDNHHGKNSNSIAIISDCEGKAIEIEMQKKAKGVLVNLCLAPQEESLADDRTEYGPTNNLIVGSIHQLI